MTEYRKFYGITDSADQVEGEIFEIQKELFASDKSDWMKEGVQRCLEDITTPETEVPLALNRQVSRHLLYFTAQAARGNGNLAPAVKKVLPDDAEDSSRGKMFLPELMHSARWWRVGSIPKREAGLLLWGCGNLSGQRARCMDWK
ncbi:MAG: hypothetical protein U5J63_16040 [Fodinibius sp.]|nr:hypothetical protein [Fodinibius sp.]